MAISIFCVICGGLFLFALGAFEIFVIFKLRKIDDNTDSKPNHNWSMGVYMEDIPQNEQNTAHLGSVPLKMIYDSSEYSDLIVPRVGEEICGVHYSGQYRFDMTGTVTRVFYNIDMNWIVVHCKCKEIIRRDQNA